MPSIDNLASLSILVIIIYCNFRWVTNQVVTTGRDPTPVCLLVYVPHLTREYYSPKLITNQLTYLGDPSCTSLRFAREDPNCTKMALVVLGFNIHWNILLLCSFGRPFGMLPARFQKEQISKCRRPQSGWFPAKKAPLSACPKLSKHIPLAQISGLRYKGLGW